MQTLMSKEIFFSFFLGGVGGGIGAINKGHYYSHCQQKQIVHPPLLCLLEKQPQLQDLCETKKSDT